MLRIIILLSDHLYLSQNQLYLNQKDIYHNLQHIHPKQKQTHQAIHIDIIILILKKMSQIVAKNILLANTFVVIFVHAFVYLLSLFLYISYRYNLKDDRMIKYIYKRCLN